MSPLPQQFPAILFVHDEDDDDDDDMLNRSNDISVAPTTPIPTNKQTTNTHGNPKRRACRVVPVIGRERGKRVVVAELLQLRHHRVRRRRRRGRAAIVGDHQTKARVEAERKKAERETRDVVSN